MNEHSRLRNRILTIFCAYMHVEYEQLDAGVHYQRSQTDQTIFHYPRRKTVFDLMYFDDHVLIAASSDIEPEILPLINKKQVWEIFHIECLSAINHLLHRYQMSLRGPDYKFFCMPDTIQEYRVPYEHNIFHGEEVRTLYSVPGFRNALTYKIRPVRNDQIAVVVYHDHSIIGIAGATNDTGELYQIGIDVMAKYRGQGIGRFLVSQVTQEIYRIGKIPLYSTSMSHLASMNTALAVGYKLALIHCYGRALQ